MKTTLSVLALLVGINTVKAWEAESIVELNKKTVKAVVLNNNADAVRCSGYIFGLLKSGETLKKRFKPVVIKADDFSAELIATSKEDFIGGSASIQCDWI
ncbi:hypothetical protein HBN50_05575 [Halobacteriovorax sp. GB3]|uniref:hypothetical protein n=1 Tax=Halobacteriovorax sp. GB3 TaxID=2719615 RepID=UPI00235EC391|nr:hypothetical protein [Halobacteriovorax sp. GB3]MDD0852557.1 hypothetical protein [Halobacteriovorax sp. GB3]